MDLAAFIRIVFVLCCVINTAVCSSQRYYGAFTRLPIRTESAHTNTIQLSGGIIINEDNNIITCGLADHLGSGRIILDQINNAQSVTMYGPYGKREERKNGIRSISSSLFTGTYTWDAVTGLYSSPSRKFDPESKSFLSRDVLRSFSRYNYVQSNPVCYIDQDGNSPTSFSDAHISGHSKDLQRAVFEALNPGEAVAIRGMDPGAFIWDKLNVGPGFKPMAATHTDFSAVGGYRETNAGIFVADADIAWHIRRGPDARYQLTPNEVVTNTFVPKASTGFLQMGHQHSPLLHGAHMNVELMFTKQMLTADHFGGHDLSFFRSYYEKQVFIYGKLFLYKNELFNGYIAEGKMEASLNEFAPFWRENSDGGQLITDYSPVLQDWQQEIDPAMGISRYEKTQRVLMYHELYGKFPSVTNDLYFHSPRITRRRSSITIPGAGFFE